MGCSVAGGETTAGEAEYQAYGCFKHPISCIQKPCSCGCHVSFCDGREPYHDAYAYQSHRK